MQENLARVKPQKNRETGDSDIASKKARYAEEMLKLGPKELAQRKIDIGKNYIQQKEILNKKNKPTILREGNVVRGAFPNSEPKMAESLDYIKDINRISATFQETLSKSIEDAVLAKAEIVKIANTVPNDQIVQKRAADMIKFIDIVIEIEGKE